MSTLHLLAIISHIRNKLKPNPPQKISPTPSRSPATPQLLARSRTQPEELHRLPRATAAIDRPAYQDIAAHYQNAGDTPSTTALAARIDHPLPGWNDYPRGPPEPLLSGADRLALAQWIVHNASPSP